MGIDIGTSFIKAVALRRRGSKFCLENYGEIGVPFPEERVFRAFEKDTLLLSDQDIAQAIQSICQEAKIQVRDVNFSIPDFSSFFTTFKLPIMTKEEIPEALRYEVRPYIPMPLSEITLDWVITEGEMGKTPTKVLAVAIPNDVIRQYQEIARVSKLNLRSLEPEVFSLVRSLRHLFLNEKEKRTTALIDIGARTTTCSILDGEVLKISHSFNIGSNELTETLARSLNIDYNKAGMLKEKYGLSQDNSAMEIPSVNVRGILLPLIDSAVSEAKKVFRDFFQNEGKEVDKIILAGGSVFLPGLKEYFSQEFGKEIIIADPFSGLSCPVILKDTLQKAGPSYAVAVGLALKGLE